jgi:hypothetical protein
MHTCTCHTPGCSNDGIPITMTLTYLDDFGDEQVVGSVACGVCAQPITDIDPPLASA